MAVLRIPIYVCRKRGGFVMEEYGKYFIIYGYILPTIIMLVWAILRVYSELKTGKKYVSGCINTCWPLLIPGVSLWGVFILLLLVIDKFHDWYRRTIKDNQRKDDIHTKVLRCKKLGGREVPKSCHVLNGRKESCKDLFFDEREKKPIQKFVI